MKNRNLKRASRRTFLETVALGATASVFGNVCHATSPAADGPPAKAAGSPNEFRFTEPFDGGVIHEECGPPVLGTETGPDGKKMLKIRVAGSVPPGAKLELFTADGREIPTSVQDGAFQAVALLKDRITEIKARTTINGAPREIRTRVV